MSKKLGNYNWNYCEKHGRYATTPNSEKGCPKCREENKWYKKIFKRVGK